MKLVDKSSGHNLADFKSPSTSPVWNFKFVDSLGELKMGELHKGNVTFEQSADSQTLHIAWNDITLSRGFNTIASINSVFTFELSSNSKISEWSVSFEVVHGPPIGLWESHVTIPISTGSDKNGELFYPTGFGTIFSDPIHSTGGLRARTYPCGEASMQFMALGSKTSTTAVYMSALDAAGEAKSLQYSSTSSLSPSKPSLSITIFPADAGVSVSKWRSPYKVAVGIVTEVSSDEGRPLWHEAGVVYRDWALKNVRWTQSGPLSSKEFFPTWYTDNSIWLNTHWQCHDIFNETGGDPTFVLSYTKQIAERLQEPSLALHWYEWQQGPDPSPEGRYKFDTHYPDYFPARVNFKSAVQELQSLNISIFPYINGRISDVNSNAYLTENGSVYCSKQTPVKLVNPDMSEMLTPYVETYGSNASFCVTNPFTSYWQGKVADTVEELVMDYNVAGVYIDQIASAVPKLCWDSVHEHSLGGGDFWTKGYEDMMNEVQSRLTATYERPMVTEDNAEPYMNTINGYLSLNAYKHSFSQGNIGSLQSTSHMAPAFPLVYGGYYVAFGAIWSRNDFTNKDWWSSKLANMFVTGSQLGWFSLAGIENDPEDSCGAMGVGDLMLDPSNDDIITFLRLLARSRSQVVDYLVHGRMTRPPVLRPAPTALLFGEYDFDTVAYGAWRHATQNSVIVLLAGCTESVFDSSVAVNFSQWGFNEEIKTLEVWEISQDSRMKVGEVNSPADTWSFILSGRTILMLEFVAI